MRRTNLRVALTGLLMIVVAAAFFLSMLSIAPKSNDPAGMMRTVGTVSGAVAGIGLVMALFGFIGTKT